ncbi:DUF6838 family protein [Paenibacillus aurantiacus]|uniref:DUF6838 family protein n=1 Tax=Paenibacillus aurantiacus TaxID=1936118 RepID=A0ABV5KP43_9BACL
MLSRSKLNRAINERIKAGFPDIPFQSDVEEGFQRPSFFVVLETASSKAVMGSVLRDMTCRIRYFPSDRHQFKLESYDAQDRLEALFSGSFEAEGRVIIVSECRPEVIDKVVHFDFDFTFYDDKSEVDGSGADPGSGNGGAGGSQFMEEIISDGSL